MKQIGVFFKRIGTGIVSLFRKRERPTGGKKKVRRVLLIVICSVLGLALLGGGAAALYVRHLQRNAASLFDSTATTPTPAPTAVPAASAEPTPTPTPDPYAELLASADTSMMKDVVNVLLMGVDYAEERDDWEGKHAFHADVMIVVAINFEENCVDLISLPRDTYAKIPGVEGKYKLNASIDCGGGWPTEGGFEKVCEAAEWMLGGIPVDYYYAVSMPVVKELVDIIGGVEYNVEMDFSMQGREYHAGRQFMDGQAVLDYCRVRQDIAQEGDEYRVNRQKEIMLELFRAAKRRQIIAKIPQIIDTFQGDLYTNCTYEQTAALALFAYGLDPANVRMHSMGGNYYDIYNWLFCITDQYNRIEIIRDVYGIEVPYEEEYSERYCLREWGEMRAEHYIEASRTEYQQIAAIFDADVLPEPEPVPEVTGDPEATEDPNATPVPTPAPTPVPTLLYSDAQHADFEKLRRLRGLISHDPETEDYVYLAGEDLLDACWEYRELFIRVAGYVGYADNVSWFVPISYQIPVDFN